MDSKEILTKTKIAIDLIRKQATVGGTSKDDDRDQVLLIGLELLANLLVDINRIADAAEKPATKHYSSSGTPGGGENG